MTDRDYDLFVIGAGSGGVRGARMAAQRGARVAVAEYDRFGGTCVIRGCVPKKLLSYAAHVREDVADAAGYGWQVGDAAFDWPTLIANKDGEIARLEGIYQNLLANAGVTVHRGRAQLLDANTVLVGNERITADTILIATGGHPVKPDIPGKELGFTSDEAFHLPELPDDVTIVGGGYISVEFAGIFNGLGARVTQLYRRGKILRGFDEDVRDALTEEMGKKGIAVRTQAEPARIDRLDGGHLRITLTDGETLDTGAVMFATGRAPNTGTLGLEAAGVEMKPNGAIAVDAYSRTSAGHIFAVGDVTDRIQLTPVAIAEAMAVVDTLYGPAPRPMDYTNVPSAVFADPPVATVGLTEDAAVRAGHAVEIYRTRFRPMKFTLPDRDEKAMMKLVVDAGSRTVLGAHIVGLDAPEMMQGIAVALKAGATKETFDATVGIHPTSAEEVVTLREPVARREGAAGS